MIEDEYELASLDLTGLALDIGAHIGAVTIALALDNPTLRIKAVEVVPENVEMLRLNVAQNNVTDRVEIIEKAAGGPDEQSRTCYMRHRSHPAATDEYVAKSRYIANSFWSPEENGAVFDAEAVEIGCVSLDDLATEDVSFIKIDCEGAEWEFFRAPALAKVTMVTGEYHWDYRWQGDAATLKADSAKRSPRAANAQDELHRLFDRTHTLTSWSHPTIGHFTAMLRA